MQIGPYNISAIEAGDFALDGGAMFGVAPKTLWEKKIPADERNRIHLVFRCMLIEGNNRRILVDVGAGTKDGEKFADIYKISYSRHSLKKSLAERGIAPKDITDVIITHLHFDHAGGSTEIGENGEIVPTFPSARYYVQKAQLDWARSQNPRDQASYISENFEPLIEAGKMTVLDGPKEIAPGVWIKVTHGHTPGQQHAFVTDGKAGIFYLADLIPTSAHIDVVWTMAYDLAPLTVLKEKTTLLDEVVKNGWILFFEHCPLMSAGRVSKDDDKYEVKPVTF